MRRTLIIAAAVLAGLLLVLLAVPMLVDVERFKPRILAAISDGVGRPVTMAGPLQLSLLPRPRLSAEGLAVADRPGFGDQPMVTVDRLDVEIALLPLLSGNLDIRRLVLRQPVIRLIQNAGGDNNWTFGDSTVAADDDAAPASSDGPAIAIGRMVLSDARVMYRDLATDSQWTLDGLEAKLAMAGSDGPYDLALRGQVDGVDFSLEAGFGQVMQGPAPVQANGAMANGALQWAFDGEADAVSSAIAGRLTIDAADTSRLGRLLAAAGLAGDGLPARALALSSQFSLDREQVQLADLQARLGQSALSGQLSLALTSPARADISLNASLIDLGDILPKTDPSAPAAGPVALSLPADLAADLMVTVARLEGTGVGIEQAVMKARLAAGVMEVDAVRAKLPGGDINASGVLTAPEGQAAFDGQFEAGFSDLRAIMRAFDLAGDWPASAYRQARLAGRLGLAGETIALTALDGQLDDSRLSGALRWHRRARPGFDAQISIDRLDLDRYVPAGTDEASAKAATDDAAPLAGLAGLDGTLRLDIGRLERGAMALDGLALEAALLQNMLQIDRLRMGRDDELTLALDGQIRDLAAKPKLDLGINAAGAGLDRAFTFLAMPVPAQMAATGPFSLNGKVAGTLDGLALDLEANIGALTGAVTGRADGLGGDAPRYDLSLDARHPSLAAMARQFQLADLPATDTPAPVRLNAKLKAATGGDFSTAGQLRAGSGTIAFAFDRRPGAQSANLTARAPDFRAFIRDLGFDYRPMVADLGALDFTLALAGDEDAMAVERLNAAIGDMAIGGGGQLTLAGDVPNLSLDLAAGALLLDRLLPPAETGASQAAAGTGARWSDEALDLEWIGAIDGRLTLHAERLSLRGYDFTAPRLELSSSGKKLEVSELSGQLFGGPAQIAGSLDATSTPAFAIEFDIAQVPVEDLLFAAAAIRPATGTMSVAGQFAGQGMSEQAIVAALAGQAQLAARDGVIRRVDLARINTRLESLSTVNDFLRLTGTALRGGETAYRHLSLELRADDGIVRSRDFSGDVDGADVAFQMQADLPAWTIDARAQMQLQSNAQAPAIGATIIGDFDNPTISYQTKALERWVSARLGAAVLKGVVTGEGVGLKDLLAPKPPAEDGTASEGAATTGEDGTGNATPVAPDETAPATEPKTPKEEIRDLLLKGLFGKKDKEPAQE
ncbi:MAG: AsmA family protein [Sphingomonadales bacterium]